MVVATLPVDLLGAFCLFVCLFAVKIMLVGHLIVHFIYFVCRRLEAAKDDYRIRCEELEKEISELRQQNDELTTLADEAQSLKDEIDVLRYSLTHCHSPHTDADTELRLTGQRLVVF